LYLKMHPKYIGTDVVSGNFSFKNLKPGLIKVSKKISSREKEVLKIDNNVLDAFEQQLEFVLTKIINDDFEQVEDIKACQWCDYQSICKR